MQDHVMIPNEGGKDIAAVLHESEKTQGRLAILCPGYLDTKDYRHLVCLAEDLAAVGYTSVRYDPTGTWESGGSISDYSVSRQLDDTRTILEYMLRRSAYSKVLLGGHSRGGLISLLYAVRDPRVSDVLMIMSPYTIVNTIDEERVRAWKENGFRLSKRDIPGSELTKEFKVPYSDIDTASQYNALNTLINLKARLYLVAGELDDVAPASDMQLIFDRASEPKSLKIIQGIGHDYRHHEEEIKRVNAEILRLLS